MSKNFNRLALLCQLVTFSAAANGQFADGEFQPWEPMTVTPSELSASVDHRVLYFAHFTCQYCRQAHSYLPDWGQKLPRPFEFEVVPAIGIGEHLPMAVAYYVVVQVAPGRLRQYQEQLFRSLQEGGRSATDPSVYYEAAEAIGMPGDVFRRTAKSRTTRMFVERAQRLTAMYAVDEVPTVVLANQYKTGPGRVQNDQFAFVSVLNGLISRIYEERQK